MGEITLHSDRQTSVTSVSNIFIDNYMADANGEFVKIYLYLLRLMGKPSPTFSLSSIADKFEHTEKDVKRALSYWERMHLLRLEYDEKEAIIGIHLLESQDRPHTPSATDMPPAEIQTTIAIPVGTKESTAPSKKQYTPDDIAMYLLFIYLRKRSFPI